MENYNELLALRKKIENTLNYQLSLSNLNYITAIHLLLFWKSLNLLIMNF